MASSIDEKPSLLLRYDRFGPWTILTADHAIVDAKVLPSKETGFYYCRTIDNSEEMDITAIRGGHHTSGPGLLYAILVNLKSDLGYDLEDVQLSSDREVYIKPAFYGWYKDDPWQKVVKIACTTLEQKFKVVVEGRSPLDD
jgi:hypothetical protein